MSRSPLEKVDTVYTDIPWKGGGGRSGGAGATSTVAKKHTPVWAWLALVWALLARDR